MAVTPPLVSVLIPLYNHARYVNRCLDSVLEDGYPRIEIIIIDDGSKDNSATLAQQWFEKQDHSLAERFELVSRPNKGVTRTLNELVSMARGEFVILLASDDFLLPGGIEARLEYLKLHPQKSAVFGDCIVVDDNGIKTRNSGIVDLYGGHIECLVREDLLALELVFNWCVTGPGFMARRDMYEEIGLYDETLAVEDWDMYLRISSRGLLGFIPCHVAAYRYHGGNAVLNENMRAAQLDSLMQTAWKNSRAFKGILRLGLLYKHFSLKQNTAGVQASAIKKYFNRKICKLLHKLSVRRYKRIIDTHTIATLSP